MKLIGTDQKVYNGYIRYCTCILDTETGLLEKKYSVTNPMSRNERLHHEAFLTFKYQENDNDELHFDYSPNPKHKSNQVYQAYKNLANGKFKPDAFMATSVADYFLTH